MGCLFAIFAIPYHFIRWAINNGWKGAIALVVVLATLLGGYFMIRGEIDKAMAPNSPAPAAAAANLPGVKAAPYLVETWSRSYYAAKAVRNKDDTVTLTDYWELIKGKWTLTKGALTLDKNFGNATIKRR